MKASNISKDEINDVILVGGSTKIPKIQEIISNFFNRKNLLTSINQDEVVAYGSALEGNCMSHIYNKNESMIIHMIPYAFGIKTNDDEFSIFVNENTYLPFKNNKVFLFPKIANRILALKFL